MAYYYPRCYSIVWPDKIYKRINGINFIMDL
jgi:hypothetical protein